jgi:outer membrane protein OmpA-like peptidoglycan-associated protein
MIHGIEFASPGRLLFPFRQAEHLPSEEWHVSGNPRNESRLRGPFLRLTKSRMVHSCSFDDFSRREKMKVFRILLLFAAVPFAVHTCLAQSKDADGCKDSPLIARFPGSIIYECEDKADNTYNFTDLGPKHEDKTIEGEYHYLYYNEPDNASPAQVNRNLVTAFKSAGYTFLKNNGNGQFTVHMGRTWIEGDVTNGNNYKLHIVVETPLTQDVAATAADLSTGITGAGHVVVNGILFDTAKADVKPESDPALQEVAKLLKGDHSLKVYVVGHTDNVGGLAANMDLSKRRAASVVLALTTKYGVPAGQLQPYGDGPYAPVASNDSEDGRTLNRRVELVKQ